MSALPTHCILFHKQKTSGRLRFLRWPGTVVQPALPAGARLLPEHQAAVLPHPAAPIAAAARGLGLAENEVEASADYLHWLAPQGQDASAAVPVILGEFTTIDPPFAAAEAVGARFIALTEIRDLPSVEQELLRLAYEHVLG
jgi:hypothetical protein